MGLFGKKPLSELLEQRPDGTLSNQVATLFYPDPTWAYEKDTSLPMMFRPSARLGDIPYSVRWLGQKDKNAKAIGSGYYDEIVNVYTYMNILYKRGDTSRALVPFFVELYGIKENLIDRCGALEQLFADASYTAAMDWLEKAEKLHHKGAAIVRSALQNVQNKEKLFPYPDVEDSSARDFAARAIDFCDSQKSFLISLHDEAKNRYEQSKGSGKIGDSTFFELQTDVRVAITWLAMHKVPWALRTYCDGSLLEESTGQVYTHFPIGYYYSNIDTDYHRNFERREKAYAYSIEKGLALLKEAEADYAEMKKQSRSAGGETATAAPDALITAGMALYNNGLYQEAFDALRPLAEENNEDALRLCASMLLSNQVKPVSWELTFRLLESEYNRGNTAVSELMCSLYQKKGSKVNAMFWGERGIEDGYPNCAYILAQMCEEGSKEYNDYIFRGASAGSAACSYLAAWQLYKNNKGSSIYLDNARRHAQNALDGGIEEARDLIKAIDDLQGTWDYINTSAKLAEMERSREQEARAQQEKVLYWQKELQFLSSLNDPYTAMDSTGRALTVDPKSGTATDGTNTYGVSEENLKKMRTQRILDRKD